jgi:hypothetical protein
MKNYIFSTFSILMLLMMGSCQEPKKSFIIPEGHVGMFGYGSLMSKKLIDTGLLAEKYDGPYLSAHLKGYKRSWSFVWPSTLPGYTTDGQYYRSSILVEGDTIFPQNIHYLNIREDSNSVINGVLYIVPFADLPSYDGWELGYERFEVTDLISDYIVEGGPVFAYKALPEFTKDPSDDFTENIIEQSYMDIILDAFGYWGKEFEEEYQNSTEPVNPRIFRESINLPWIDPPLDKLEELRSKFKTPS